MSIEEMATDALKLRYYELRKSPEVKTNYGDFFVNTQTRKNVTEMNKVYTELTRRAGNA